jgi:hypothetical protein
MGREVFILGICGRAGSGKTSVASMLQERYGAKRLSFAAPLKRMAIDIFGFSEEQVYGDAVVKETVDPRWGVSPREVMQKLGTAGREHLGLNIWIKAALAQVKSPGFYVVEDLRYRNEAKALHDLGHTVFRLHCPDRVSSDDGTHPSEAEVDLIPDEHVTAEIYSSRSRGLDHLFDEVEHALEKVQYVRRVH